MQEEKKQILILGTGNAQTDFIKYCSDAGYTVHAFSYKHEGRGIQEADYFKLINITEAALIENYMRKANIDLLYSVGSDLAMPTVAAVVDKLGFSGFISPSTALICNNKNLLRDNLAKLKGGKYSVRFLSIEDDADAAEWMCFPAIVKPADSQGQRGITYIESAENIAQAISTAKKYSRSETAIIEEYIDGFEVSVNSYIVDGEPQFIFTTDRNSFSEFPGGIIKSHVFPTRSKVDETILYELVKDTASHLDINNGPIYFQIMLDRNNSPKIIEVTPRLDGCHLWNLIKTLSGLNLFDVILKHLSGENMKGLITQKISFNKFKNAELFFFTLPPGSKMNKNQFKIDGSEHYLEWYYKDNEIVRPLNNYMEKVGYKIVVHKQ